MKWIANLIITPPNEPAVAVDDPEVAKFVPHLMLSNREIRNVTDILSRSGRDPIRAGRGLAPAIPPPGGTVPPGEPKGIDRD
jgi:hypothetical protein